MHHQIKHCSSIAELARLLGDGDASTVLHILKLRDKEIMEAQLRVLKTNMSAIVSCAGQISEMYKTIHEEKNSIRGP